MGSVTVMKHEPSPFEVVLPRNTGWLSSVKVIFSLGAKFLQLTVRESPGSTTEELVVIAGPWSRNLSPLLRADSLLVQTVSFTAICSVVNVRGSKV